MDRKVERLIADEEWEKITIKQLKLGDVFRMWNYIDYKNTWERYMDEDGETAWEITSDSYIHPIYNIWTIHAKSWIGSCLIILWDAEHLIYGGDKECN